MNTKHNAGSLHHTIQDWYKVFRGGSARILCAVKGESPQLLFPNGFDPSTAIFGADRVDEGFLYLVSDPLDVLKAQENGIANVVAYLAHVTPQWLEMLASLMDERKCEALGFFAS